MHVRNPTREEVVVNPAVPSLGNSLAHPVQQIAGQVVFQDGSVSIPQTDRRFNPSPLAIAATSSAASATARPG